MANDLFTADEARKLAVLIARVWSDPKLAGEYARASEAVLAGAGITLAGRAAPEIPEKPAALATQNVVAGPAFSSATSVSTVTCPCSGCSASCACLAVDLRAQTDAIMKLAADPGAREQARKMTAAWDIKVNLGR